MAFTLDRALSNFSIIDGGMQGGLPVIQDGACLFFMTMSNNPQLGLQGQMAFTTV
jgi:hypothetical protein